jgi:hypothetical protein
MKKMHFVTYFLSVLVTMAWSVAADQPDTAESATPPPIATAEEPAAQPPAAHLGLKFRQYGFIGIEGGEIVQGVQDPGHASGGSPYINKSWMERLLFQYDNDITITDRIRAVIAMECQLAFQYPYDQLAIYDIHQPVITVYPDRAEALYTLGDPKQFWLQFGFGYFPFRTNPDVRNLGEYLFRTNTYPLYVMTNFNRPYSRLLGIRVSSTFIDSTVHIDALLTSSNLIPPLVDGSLSFLASYRLLKFFDVGAGISFCHLFPVDDKLTTPPNPGGQSEYQNGDTTAYFTFAGTKPMARFALDVKRLIPKGDQIFSASDLRIYGEWCVSAWENQTNTDTSTTDQIHNNNFYNNRGDRTLYMMGINLPLFKLIELASFNTIPETPDDVFSIEVEHFPNTYPNSLVNVIGNNISMVPVPATMANYPGDLATSKVFPWYWSFYFKKVFLDKFALIVQLARDHMKPYGSNLQYLYTGDILLRQGDWWWNVRLNLNY